MTTVAMPTQAQQRVTTHETMLIDLDVHERPPQGLGMRDLVPYLDPHWARYLTGESGIGLVLRTVVSRTSWRSLGTA